MLITSIQPIKSSGSKASSNPRNPVVTWVIFLSLTCMYQQKNQLVTDRCTEQWHALIEMCGRHLKRGKSLIAISARQLFITSEETLLCFWCWFLGSSTYLSRRIGPSVTSYFSSGNFNKNHCISYTKAWRGPLRPSLPPPAPPQLDGQPSNSQISQF